MSDQKPTSKSKSTRVPEALGTGWMPRSAKSRGVVGFEVILDVYSPLSIAAMGPLSVSG